LSTCPVRLPKLRRAWRAASSRLKPSASNSSARSFTWNASSRSRSLCSRACRNRFQNRLRHAISHYALHALGESLPTFLFIEKLLFAFGGQRVEAGLAIFLGSSPFGAHPALLFHAVKGRVERPLFHSQQLVGNAVDMGGDGVAVHAPGGGQALENEEGQRALE